MPKEKIKFAMLFYSKILFKKVGGFSYKKLDPQRLLETILFIATEGPLAVSGLRWLILMQPHSGTATPYDGRAISCTVQILH